MSNGPSVNPPRQQAEPQTPLQAKLQAQLDSERRRQELREDLWQQRRDAEQQDAALRIKALEEALADARAEVAARQEVERKLGRVRLEAAKLAVELGQAQRDAEEARKAAEPGADQKVAEARKAAAAAEKATADARAEAEQERKRREELQIELTKTRQAHERQLTEAHEALARERSGRKREQERLEKRIFEARGRSCAVCRRTEAGSPGALRSGGWALGAEIDLCPDCQENEWQLPKGGSLPFRRSSHRGERAG